MSDETKLCRLVKVGVCCKATDPKRPFHAVVELPGGTIINLHVSASELLSFRRFRARVLEETMWLINHEASAGGLAGRQAWDAAIEAALKNQAPETAPCH